MIECSPVPEPQCSSPSTLGPLFDVSEGRRSLDLSDGWQAFSYRDLIEVCYGSERIPGYFDVKRRINLSKLDLVFSDSCQSKLPVLDPPDFLEAFHQRRLDYYNQRQLTLYMTDDYKTSGYATKPLLSRGMPAYQAKVGDLFEDLRDYMVSKNLPCVHLRLSLQTESGTSPLDSLLDAKGILNRLMSWLTIRLGHRPEYIWHVEPTIRGHAHLHFMFIGMDFLISKERLDQWFIDQGLGDEHGVWIESLRCPDSLQYDLKGNSTNRPADVLLGYLIKYILKPHSDKKWCGLLGLTRKREWGMSNTLRAKVKAWKASREDRRLACIGLTNSNSDSPVLRWEVVGILENGEISAFIDPETTGRPPPNLEDLRALLRETQGMSSRWSWSSGGLWQMHHQNRGRP